MPCARCAKSWDVYLREEPLTVNVERHSALYRCPECSMCYEVFPEERRPPQGIGTEQIGERFPGYELPMKGECISRPGKGYELNIEGDRLVLHVLCGGVALFEVVVVLNEEEREEFGRRGEAYLDQLAKDVQRDPHHYSARAEEPSSNP